MNVYQNKFEFKLVLLGVAFLIAAATLFYTNHLSEKIESNERKQIKLWAEAIENKAQLVRYTNDLFDKLGQGERNRVKEFAEALQLVIASEDNNALSFATGIIAGNENIPVILVSGSTGDILEIRNLENFPNIEQYKKFEGDLARQFSHYPPIPVLYKFQSESDLIYYDDSKLFKELKSVLNGIIESFISEVVVNSATVPVIYTDENGKMLAFGNIDTVGLNEAATFNQRLEDMADVNTPIEIDLGDGQKRLIYFENSDTLKQLQWYPVVQLLTIMVFLAVAYFAFSSSRKAEQNQVWVGLAKETAHQLGTPISSLAAWVEYIKAMDGQVDESTLSELDKDISKLALVAERFSKIGSKPDLNQHSLAEIINEQIDYIRQRASKKLSFEIDVPSDIQVQINPQLFNWVIENLLKNALDAMDGVGVIKIKAKQQQQFAIIEIEDSGKGITRANQGKIFEPGFSTKKRGWGLGLSLTKRIVEQYHNGKISLAQSVVDKGTVFKVEIPVG